MSFTEYVFRFDPDGEVVCIPYAKWDRIIDGGEEAGGVINLQHRKMNKEVADKYHWTLKPNQIQKVIDCIW